MQIPFERSARSTIGLEWELMLADAETGELVPAAPGILQVLDGGEAITDPATIVRVIIDSLAAAFADTVDAVARLTSTPLTRLHMIGGGANIDLLVERTAAATGLRVVVGHPEATSIGNICVQAAASGMMPTVAAARQRTEGMP